MQTRAWYAGAVAFAAGLAATVAVGQGGSTAIQEIEKYRQALQDGNPAELWEARGEDLWKAGRTEERLAGEVRPGFGAGRGEGRLRAAAALLPASS